MNNPVFQQLNARNVNPALYKVQLTNKLKEMQANGIDPAAEIQRGLSEGKINQQQVDMAMAIARNAAKSLFGVGK